ncbi:MAG: glycosyltransferase family 4 protein, partial [Gaiellaceae bacterium]
VARGAAAVVVASEREAAAVVEAGVPAEKVRVRGNGFPDPATSTANNALRSGLGIPPTAKVILYVGRIAAGKGIEHLLDATRELRDAQLVIAGPDDRHGTSALIRQAQRDASTKDRVHVLPVAEEPPHDLYPQADVFVLASAGESFGIVAAEAAAAGTPVIVSDRSGIAGFFRDGEALVVPYERDAVVEAVRKVLSDEQLRERLGRGGVEAARRTSWDHVTDVQEEIYRDVAARTAVTKLSTDGS